VSKTKDRLQTPDDLLRHLRNEIAIRTDTVARGVPQTYEGYQNLVGAITGLRIAEQLVQALLESGIDSDDGDTNG
jgi:hypothetical protein